MKKIFTYLITADAIMLLLHLFFGRTTYFLNLDYEQNLPTVYQSLKLILFGIYFLYLVFGSWKKLNYKAFILPVGLFMVLLGLDEFFQIHENIYKILETLDLLHPSRIVEASMRFGYRSSLWILYYLPAMFLFFLWSGYWLSVFQSSFKSNFKLVFAAIALVFAILVAEIISTTGEYSQETYFILVSIEETAEMIFASILVLAGMKILKKQKA